MSKLDFFSSVGFLDGHGELARSAARGGGPRAVISDFGVLSPHPETEELQLSHLFAGVGVEAARAAVGWPLRMAERIETVPPPTASELAALRGLHERTERAHAQKLRIPD